MHDVAERPAAHDAEKSPVRSDLHHALEAFLSCWKAEGTSYGGTDQSGANPRANGATWESTHEGKWHTGKFFLVQDERAIIGGDSTFDTLSIMGVDAKTGEYFAQSFENHGFERRYKVARDGNRWTLSGEHERATITFNDNGRTQEIVWEWKPGETWLPLCERTARKI